MLKLVQNNISKWTEKDMDYKKYLFQSLIN
jgi:hypothetical protein